MDTATQIAVESLIELWDIYERQGYDPELTQEQFIETKLHIQKKLPELVNGQIAQNKKVSKNILKRVEEITKKEIN